MANAFPVETEMACPRCGGEVKVVADIASVTMTTVGLSQSCALNVRFHDTTVRHECKEKK